MSNNWVMYSLISAFFASLVAIFGKIGLKNVDSNAATTIRAVIMALFLIILFLAQKKMPLVKQTLSQPIPLLFIVLSGIAGALSWLFYFKALKTGNAAQIASLDKLSLVFTIILASTFLGEKLTVKSALGAIIVVIGTILIGLG
jgi:transporter family protein